MRTGTIIAILVAAIVVISGIIWYNNRTEQARLDEQQAVEVAREKEAARDAELAREEKEEAAAAEQAALVAQEAKPSASDEAEVGNETPAADDGPTVVGDAITEDTIVVDSEAQEPTILEPKDTTTTVRNVDDAESEDPASSRDTTTQAEEADGATSGDSEADAAAVTTIATDPEQLLTPEEFDREDVLALLDRSEQLTAERRSTLRALVEGASSNPDMINAAIGSIRAALDLPPLD